MDADAADLLITFLLSRDRLWLGHLQLVVFMSTTLVARIFGFLHDGTTLAMGNQRVITIVEIVFLILNPIGLVLQPAWLKTSPFPNPTDKFPVHCERGRVWAALTQSVAYAAILVSFRPKKSRI